MKKITVSASRTYDILISGGLLDCAGELASPLVKAPAAAIVTDDIVGALYGERLARSLLKSGYQVSKFVIVNGEPSKNAANYIELLNFLAREHFTRNDVIFALGGGVVGDLAGFAASTYMRGIRLVQLPTTLLAAVDSSVGGKTAIDLAAGKNLAGTFYQPNLVLCDYALMSTLSDDVMRDGIAEVIKYGVISDSTLFDILRAPITPQLEEIITRCVTIKRDIVVVDEKETGIRKLLNFGHSVGHAVEACSGYTISHGKAVAIGMAVMSRSCAAMGICSEDTSRAIISLIKSCLLPVATNFSPDQLADAMLNDKKRSGGTMTLVLPKTVGTCILQDMATEELEHFISLGL
jgi:3-dehydroquinate synthase